MAEREIRRLLEEISAQHPCLAAKVIHRVGIIPVGETAIYVGVASRHRGEAIALLAEFMDRLKQDVPIWKRRAIAGGGSGRASPAAEPAKCRRLRAETRRLLARRSHFRNPFALPAVARRARAAGGGVWPRAARNGLRAGRFAAGRPFDARRLRNFER